MIEESHIPLLRELTANLGKAPRPVESIREYPNSTGTAIQYGIEKTKAYAISKVFMPAGYCLGMHRHNEFEFLIVISGEMILTAPEDQPPFENSSCYALPAGRAHSACTPIDTWLLAITIPASKDFPDGK